MLCCATNRSILVSSSTCLRWWCEINKIVLFVDECWISMKISTHLDAMQYVIWRYHLWLFCNCPCKEFAKSCSIPFFRELLYFRCNQKALLQAAYANAFNPYGSQRTGALVRNWSYQICFIILKFDIYQQNMISRTEKFNLDVNIDWKVTMTEKYR